MSTCKDCIHYPACSYKMWCDLFKDNANFVEVVRCKNCKHLTIHNSPTLYAYCEKTHYRFEPFETDTRTHFCGFGELKEREGK